MILDKNLTLAQFISVVRGGEKVELSEAARERIEIARAVIEKIVDGEAAVYGVNTGFGKFANVRVSRDQLAQLQHNLIVTHAIGVGDPMPTEVVRGMLLLRAQSLALGHSGARVETVERLLTLLNKEVYPIIPAQGSVGASGDLAPLAHLVLPLLGIGEFEVKGERRPAAEVLKELGLEPLQLQAKEGLALINGTQFMGSLLALALADAKNLLHTANLAASMTVEALKGSHRPFAADVVSLRPHPGMVAVSEELRHFLRDSEVGPQYASSGKVQDAYSLRAIPQVHGASADIIAHVERVLAVEFASVTDNPLIFPDTGDVVSGGHFHGQPLAVHIDALKIAVAELASISERRCEQMLNPALSGLPGFLAPDGGLNSGYMIAQYTAAALVSENKILCHPASVDTIPTSANQEDHVSMGAHGARLLRQVMQNAQNVVSIELLCAAQAMDIQHGENKPQIGKGAEAAYKRIRQDIPFMAQDRYFRPELLQIRELLASGELLRAAQEA